MDLQTHDNGRYAYLPAIAPYSSGVVATERHELVWVTLRRPLGLASGIRRAAKVAREQAGAVDAVCAFALRSTVPLTLDGFAALNARYRELLDDNGVLAVDAQNPVARTNVVPTVAQPPETVVYGFGFSRPATSVQARTFITAGAAEIRNQKLSQDAIVRPGDTSPAGLAAKAAEVLDEMERRMAGLGARWDEVTAVDVYTRHDVVGLKDQLLERLREGAIHGLRWFPSSPPIAGLDFEMDVRGVRNEIVLD